MSWSNFRRMSRRQGREQSQKAQVCLPEESAGSAAGPFNDSHKGKSCPLSEVQRKCFERRHVLFERPVLDGWEVGGECRNIIDRPTPADEGPLPSKSSTGFAPNWTQKESHGPTAVFNAFTFSQAELKGTQKDPKIVE